MLTVGFALFSAGVIGGGDAKLAAATALWLGYGSLLDYVVIASVFGGVMALAILAMRRHPLPGFAVAWPFALHLHDRSVGIALRRRSRGLRPRHVPLRPALAPRPGGLNGTNGTRRHSIRFGTGTTAHQGGTPAPAFGIRVDRPASIAANR